MQESLAGEGLIHWCKRLKATGKKKSKYLRKNVQKIENNSGGKWSYKHSEYEKIVMPSS